MSVSWDTPQPVTDWPTFTGPTPAPLRSLIDEAVDAARRHVEQLVAIQQRLDGERLVEWRTVELRDVKPGDRIRFYSDWGGTCDETNPSSHKVFLWARVESEWAVLESEPSCSASSICLDGSRLSDLGRIG